MSKAPPLKQRKRRDLSFAKSVSNPASTEPSRFEAGHFERWAVGAMDRIEALYLDEGRG